MTWLLKNTYIIETTVVGIVELAPMLKSVKILNKRESKMKRGRVFASRISELTFERGGLGLYRGYLGIFHVMNDYFYQEYTSPVVHRVVRDSLAGQLLKRFD